MKLFEDILLRSLQAEDAQEIFYAIDAQREYLGRWLPFVESTTAVAVTQAFVYSALNAEESCLRMVIL